MTVKKMQKGLGFFKVCGIINQKVNDMTFIFSTYYYGDI